jgi:hypothetical protein
MSTLCGGGGSAPSVTETSESVADSDKRRKRHRSRQKSKSTTESSAQVVWESNAGVTDTSHVDIVPKSNTFDGITSSDRPVKEPAQARTALSKEEHRRRSEEGRKKKIAAALMQRNVSAGKEQAQSATVVLLQEREGDQHTASLISDNSEKAPETTLKADAPEFVPSILLLHQFKGSHTDEPGEKASLSRRKTRTGEKKKSTTDFSAIDKTEEVITASTHASAEMCLVCAEEMIYAAIGPCHHPICSICALRIRFKSKDKSCVVCKSHLESMLIYENSALSIDDAAQICACAVESIMPGIVYSIIS